MALTASGGVLSLGANNVVVVGRATTSTSNSNHRIRCSSGAAEVVVVAAPLGAFPSLGCCRGVTSKSRGVVASSAVKAEAVEADSSGARNLSRRGLLLAAGLVAILRNGGEAAMAEVPSYRKFVDRLDGYTFSYPSAWIQVRGAGADVFFRDPVNLDENVLVEMSSPSSSKFKGVEDLGTPEQAAKQVLQQQLTEFMSTRIGVRREAAVTDARARRGDDGRLYYEVEVLSSRRFSFFWRMIANCARVSRIIYQL